MSVWMVRGGSEGETEALSLDHNLSIIGWDDLPDLSQFNDKRQLYDLMNEKYSGSPSMRLHVWAAQIWAFVKGIQNGDTIILPLKTRRAIAVGKVTGSYTYRTDLGELVRHTRPVKWLKTDIPRNQFDPEILRSTLQAAMTVCKVQIDQAEQRIARTLDSSVSEVFKGPRVEPPDVDVIPPTDVEQLATDQIVEFISQRFREHEFARLVDEVLRAQGYVTRRSPKGPDGGVDILAGFGPLGFDPPRLCVQVKSSGSPVDVNVLRELQGTMATHQADHGLLVSWGGFKDSVWRESKVSYFKVRLWDSGDLLSALLDNYDKLPDGLRAELPLKKVWAVVAED